MKKARLYHALKRLPEARRNLFRRLVYGNIERKFNSTVSINYSFQEIEAIKISKSEILSTKKLNGYSSLLEHNFESRFN
jgi:hypothetical protein